MFYDEKGCRAAIDEVLFSLGSINESEGIGSTVLIIPHRSDVPVLMARNGRTISNSNGTSPEDALYQALMARGSQQQLFAHQ